MKNYVFLCLALAAVTMFAACSNPEPQPKPNDSALPQPAPKEEAPAATPAPAPAPEAAPAPEKAEPAVVGATLVGSTWKIGEFTATFKDDTTVSLKGGPLAAIAPNGLDAKYTLADGKVTVSAMGQTKSGTFDGTNLIIDGDTAVRQQ